MAGKEGEGRERRSRDRAGFAPTFEVRSLFRHGVAGGVLEYHYCYHHHHHQYERSDIPWAETRVGVEGRLLENETEQSRVMFGRGHT